MKIFLFFTAFLLAGVNLVPIQIKLLETECHYLVTMQNKTELCLRIQKVHVSWRQIKIISLPDFFPLGFGKKPKDQTIEKKCFLAWWYFTTCDNCGISVALAVNVSEKEKWVLWMERFDWWHSSPIWTLLFETAPKDKLFISSHAERFTAKC